MSVQVNYRNKLKPTSVYMFYNIVADKTGGQNVTHGHSFPDCNNVKYIGNTNKHRIYEEFFRSAETRTIGNELNFMHRCMRVLNLASKLTSCFYLQYNLSVSICKGLSDKVEIE